MDTKNGFDIFEPLRLIYIEKGISQEDCLNFMMLIEIDAKTRTGNDNTFRHEEIGYQVYPTMINEWWKRSSIGTRFESLPILPDKELDMIALNLIVQSHKFSLDDLDILLDEMQKVMDENGMPENIPSIDLAREFVLDLRLQNEIQKADPKVKTFYEWNKE